MGGKKNTLHDSYAPRHKLRAVGTANLWYVSTLEWLQSEREW